MAESVHDCSLESLLAELHDHPVNTHRFFIEFRERWLTPQQLYVFTTQYHYFCRHFVKLLEGLLFQTPVEELEMRVELTKTLYSELGSGTVTQAHICHLERFAAAAGIDIDELRLTRPIPENRHYLDILRHLFLEAGYLQALGAELAVETTAVSEFRFFLPGLKKYPRFTEQDLTFFSMHLEEEIAHSDWLITAVQKTAQTPEKLALVVSGARTAADGWDAFWTGMRRAVFQSEHMKDS
ncbi:MAG: iron-containing redox enzyme family protein [Nitrospirales bacterium]|nr:iron-containing redox enzyme family protein [Nitrospira sp.]MDR4501700.1 iron-containing redox enzyme family protein [Nitrospirales bacterium]